MREIVHKTDGNSVFGLTVPNDIAMFFEDTNFTVVRSGNAIVYESGTSQNPTKEEVANYEFEDCRI